VNRQDTVRVTRSLRCPRCRGELAPVEASFRCNRCGLQFPSIGSIPVILPDPEGFLSRCRYQLDELARSVAMATRQIQGELAAADLLPTTRSRCLSTIEAMEGQLADVRAVLEPGLPSGPTLVPASSSVPISPVNLESLPYLFRDWGYPDEENDENQQALAAVEAALARRPMGRTLVMGAGACRLPYDLHLRDEEAEIVALDLDPVLFSVAGMVLSGESVSLREANLEVLDLAQSCRAWTLRAPRGPAIKDRLQLMVADALDPPFALGSFDTVLTPWFIDQGPSDIRDLLSTIHGLLVPGGRWINLGPLRYEPEVPIPLRFSRDEILELLRRARFRVDGADTFSVPYLVSRLNGRGKVERVMTFSATRLETSQTNTERRGGSSDGGRETAPPAWLIFRHVPIPKLPDPDRYARAHPLFRLVAMSLDGTKTLDDVTALVEQEIREPGFTRAQLRQAVRQCLAEVHPGASRDASTPH